jgi:long-chain acyl-CoA synthetase
MTFQPTVIHRVAIGDTLRRAASRCPDKLAVIDGQARLTYRELNERANRFAQFLLTQGLKKGDAVATLCLNSSELLVASYGIAKAGLIWVPMNVLLAGAQLQYILGHVEAKMVVADDELLQRVRGDVEALCSRVLVIPICGVALPGLPLFDDALRDQSPMEPEVEIHERDVAQIMYTSGTTSHPKGVLVSHLAVFTASLSGIIETGIRHDDVTGVVMPIFHCAEHSLVASYIHMGATLVIVRRFEPGAFMQTVEQHRLSWIFLLPMMYRALLDHPERSQRDLSSLRYCLYAMQPMDPATLQRLTQEICPHFALGSGQTETYPGTTYFKPEYQLSKPGPYWGSPAIINDLAIMDDRGQFLARGQVGELVVRGPNVMNGYHKNPEATEEACRFGWHHTGDLCFYDEDGLLVFVDRKKDMIKSGGENVASITVETALLGHPEVGNVVVVGLPHPHWVEAVTAFVLPRAGCSPTEQALIAHCKDRLARHEVPKAVVFLDAFPATATGKIQKNQLRTQYADFFKSATA